MTSSKWSTILVMFTLLGLVGCSTAVIVPVTATPQGVPTSYPSSSGDVPTAPAGSPQALISRESLLATLEDLTAIQPYSGWRNSASEGESEALDYVTGRLEELEYLQTLGLELERQSFHVFLGTELWETRLHVVVDGREIEVPADGLRGPRDEIAEALHFDSDGVLNDDERNPVLVEGPTLLVRTSDEIGALQPADVQGRVVFVDYTAVDRTLMGVPDAAQIASQLVALQPAGVVLVTQLSHQPGESHGSFVGDVSAFNWVEIDPFPPTLYVRLEDMGPAGITDWEDLAQVETARLTWDADVFSPATSGNLAARIPGTDPSRAVILGAHIDSPNAPGAMDDGSGSAVLLEVARVLDAAQIQPPTDLYLVWFGSEELGLYGSYHFASTHQELIDRTLAMLQIDCLTRPLDGIDGYLNLVAWSYGRFGDDRLTWPDYLDEITDRYGVWTYSANYYGVESDSTAFTGFDLPSANLIYMNHPEMEAAGGVHSAGHIHDPYDTVELAREVGHVLEEMARVALAAALETGPDDPTLRVTSPPDRRAVFVASHTESVHMAPTTFTDLGMALAWEGFDVDLVPYGQEVTGADLADADLVVALPVVDYPSPDGDPSLYDEAWSEAELAVLEDYVAGGGLLVVTNTNYRLKYHNTVLDPSEDWDDVNALGELFGITYHSGHTAGTRADTVAEHPLLERITSLELIDGNGVPFTIVDGQVLARAGGDAVVGLVGYGDAGGEVLALADVGMLSAQEHPANLAFWLNLAQYAQSH